jgi:ribosomal protein S18 acetylase RimI-like enzyme
VIVNETKYILRQARREDATRLHELHTAAVRSLCAPHYSPEIIDGWLQNRGPNGYLPPIERGAIFVAELSGRIIGFGEAATGVVVAVYVDPSANQQGVGSAILHHAVSIARRDHEGPVRVESTLNAIHFYERHGFREIKRSTIKRNHVDVPIVLMEMAPNPTIEGVAKSGARPSW